MRIGKFHVTALLLIEDIIGKLVAFVVFAVQLAQEDQPPLANVTVSDVAPRRVTKPPSFVPVTVPAELRGVAPC